MTPVLQGETAECGLACLAMISGAHGQRVELGELRRHFSASLKGATLDQLAEQAKALGFLTRALTLEIDELRDLVVPCILHWDFNHFVVLSRAGRRRIEILDPAVGRRRLTPKQVSAHFTGVALEVTPSVAFVPARAAPRLELSQLTGKVRGLGASLTRIFAIAVVLELFAIVAPMFNQVIVDDVITSGDRDLLTVLVIGFGLLLVAQTAIGLARSWMIMVLGQSISLQWSANMFGHMLRLPVAFFERRHLGDIVSRFGSIGVIQKTLTTAVVEAVLDGVMAIAALAMMLIYSPALSGVTVAAVLLYAVLRWAFYQPFRDAAAERLVIAAKESTHFLESLRAMVPVKLFGREQVRQSAWQNLRVAVQNRDVRTARMNIAFTTGHTFIFGLENLVIFGIGARLVMAGQGGGAAMFTIGMLLAFVAYKGQFSSRVAALIDYGIEVRMLGLHAERLADIALTPPEAELGTGGPLREMAPNDLAHLRASIELRNVSFRYAETEPWVLRNVSLRIEPGESVAVTGASGGGKTTLLKILLGVLLPTEGEVAFGGVAMHRLGLSNVRRQIGTVMQDDVLLTGSLLENITFFDPSGSPVAAEAAASIAQIHRDIVAMPMGYQTLVGDLGSGLSGGQKQRLLLARALYKRPRVLVLDEATSSLDVANERDVTAALARLRLTRIIVAHRPETLRGAQRVVVLRNGAVDEILRTVERLAEA